MSTLLLDVVCYTWRLEEQFNIWILAYPGSLHYYFGAQHRMDSGIQSLGVIVVH